MRNPPQERGAACHAAADDPTVELEILEQTISIEGARVLRHDALGLVSAPIPRSWIIEGNPAARHKRLAGSSDRLARTFMWDCTSGRFDWHYDEDETAHVLEGIAIIEDAAGGRRALQAGDTFEFPAGSRYQWTVPNYVRKVAFLRPPLPPGMRILGRVLARLTGLFRGKPAAAPWGG